MSQTLDASYFKGTGARNGKEREIIAEEPIMMPNRKGHNGITEDGTATTLTAEEKERPLVSYGFDSYNQDADKELAQNVRTPTGGDNSPKVVTTIVRRLTPKECERLQGMPDDWSKYGVNEKGEVYELPDSARYRLQGNGIATPFWKYLLKRISAQYERDPTMGSLFAGQGSFEYLWTSINGIGTVPWSSEIDKHGVAVITKHFGDEERGVEGDIRQFL